MENKAEQEQTQEDLPTSPAQLFSFFDERGIAYECHEHAPTFTVAESAHLKNHIPGVHCRNLFLRDKKKNMFLVVAENDTPVDLKKLQKLLGCGRLSFGSADRLWTYLGVRPGSVCPFAVINDKECAVKVVLDKSMMDAKLVNYHPLVNDMTIGLSPPALLAFLKACDHAPAIIDLAEAAPDEPDDM